MIGQQIAFVERLQIFLHEVVQPSLTIKATGIEADIDSLQKNAVKVIAKLEAMGDKVEI